LTDPGGESCAALECRCGRIDRAVVRRYSPTVGSPLAVQRRLEVQCWFRQRHRTDDECRVGREDHGVDGVPFRSRYTQYCYAAHHCVTTADRGQCRSNVRCYSGWLVTKPYQPHCTAQLSLRCYRVSL